MKMIRIKKLGLSTGLMNKIVELKDKAIEIEEILRYYDSTWLDKDLAELDDKVEQLLKDKAELTKRKAESETKTQEFSTKLLNNRAEQTKIVLTNGILKKISKAKGVLKCNS